jgi:hypothetical protein
MTNVSFGSLAPFFPFGRAMEQPTCWWQGASGQWYIHTVFPFSEKTFVQGANYVMVRREWDGKRSGLYIGQSDNLSARLPKHEKIAAARMLGANEIHMHLLASSSSERFRIETDLRNGHRTPLNEQSAPSFAGLLGAGHPPGPYSLGLLGYFK